MKTRILISSLLMAVLLSSLILPVMAQDPVQDTAQPQELSLEEQVKLGQITQKEYDLLAPQGPGCGPEAAWPGPDGYGYVGAEVAYEWVDITATGTLIEGLTDDGYLTGFPIGFTFGFYGTDYTTFDVANNGFMGFGLTSGSLSNQCPLPNSSTPNNVIALLWDDLYYNYDTGGVFYETFGACPVGDPVPCLVVEYYNWNHYGGDPGSAGTFEAILYEDGVVMLQFLDSGVETGLSSTTGIENNDAAADWGLTYACNVEFSIADELAITFGLADIPNLGESTKSAPGKVVMGEPIDYTIEILNTGLAPAMDASLVDPIPAGATYIDGSLACSSGDCYFDSGVVYWNGQVAAPPKGPAAVREGFPQAGQPRMDLTALGDGGIFAPPVHPEDVLWEQTTSLVQGGVSIDFPPEGWGAFSADDFQNAEPWSIETIYIPGWEYYGSMYNATAFHWCLYADAGGVPAGHPYEGGEFWCNSASPYDPAVTIGGTYGGDVTVDVVAAWGAPLEVPAGTWWLVFYPEFTNSGADWYYWWFADSANLSNAHLVDPMDYFGMGLLEWTPWASLGTTYWDLAFRLEGTAGGEMENPVTVSFSVMPDVGCGEMVVNEATITDVALPGPVTVQATTEVWLGVWLHEPFEGDVFPPPGWVEAHDPAGMAWTDQDLEPRGNLTGGTGKFAIVDDDYGGSVALTVAELWTPPFDIEAGYTTYLVYKTDYNNISTDESADVDISFDGGATWINLQHWNTDHRGPLTVMIDLTPFAGMTGAIVRFYYNDGGHYAWWWEIDDVQIVGCEPPMFPDIEVTPESLYAEQCPDEVTAQALNICNVGDADLTWELSELVPPMGTQDVLWDNGPLVTHPGGGYGGADLSALQTTLGMNTYGFGNQYIYAYRMADDFEVDAEWTVDQITFFAYQTNAPTDPSTITGLYFQIWDGLPDDPGSSIVFGDLVTNRLASSTWSGIYRAVDYDPTNSARPIMANTATAGVALPPGTYWLDWLTDGSLSSGPWAPPISILGETTTGNAMQNTGVWAPALDTGTSTQQGMPFIIEGTAGEPPDLPWLSEDPTSGTVPAGECQEVTVTFDSTGLAAGDYFGDLLIDSNDPDEPEVVVPVQLTVLPCEATMHVADIQGYTMPNPGGFPALVMGVRVVDGDAMPLGGVFVEATIWIPEDMAARTRYSLPNGWARFWAPAARTGNYQICVDNLTLAGYTYNPDDNVVTCMDWDL